MTGLGGGRTLCKFPGPHVLLIYMKFSLNKGNRRIIHIIMFLLIRRNHETKSVKKIKYLYPALKQLKAKKCVIIIIILIIHGKKGTYLGI